MPESRFQPRFSLTRASRAKLGAIERDAQFVADLLILPRHEAWFRRATTTTRAVSTTRIEGIGEEGHPDAGTRKEADDANANAVRAYEFIDYLSDLPEQPIDELAIRQINREFLRGASDALTPGVYRRGQNLVGSFTPPDQGDVPELMRAFAAWLRDGGEHPIVAAGIAHVHLVAVHPFWDGNGRTARGLEAMVLQRSDFHFRKLLSMEERLLSVRAHYFAALERTLGVRFGPYDATSWLDFYLSTLAAATRALVEQLRTWHRRAAELQEMAAREKLLPRMADGLLFLAKMERMARADYVAIAGVSPVTASRDLKALVDAGLLVAEGRVATTTYRLADRLTPPPAPPR